MPIPAFLSNNLRSATWHDKIQAIWHRGHALSMTCHLRRCVCACSSVAAAAAAALHLHSVIAIIRAHRKHTKFSRQFTCSFLNLATIRLHSARLLAGRAARAQSRLETAPDHEPSNSCKSIRCKVSNSIGLKQKQALMFRWARLLSSGKPSLRAQSNRK